MGGRRDDGAPGRVARPTAARGHRGWLVVGLLLAAGATAAVFFTENPLYLRVALLAVCWAFVVAAFLAGNRRADQVAAAGREAELRHAYDLELEREVAARYEYELELESRLRREAEDAMRTELGQLRTELSGVAGMRADLAALTQLRADLAGLGQLRTELAALTELRGELTGLGQLRAELGGLGELRNDLGRMRTELTEQLSGELFIERMVMRAQSVRGPAQAPPGPGDERTLEGSPSWDVDRWSETRMVSAQQPERPSAQPAPWSAQPADAPPRPIAAPPPIPPMAPPGSARSGAEQVDRQRPPSPIEWLGERSLLDEDGQRTGELPAVPPSGPHRHRRAAAPARPASYETSYETSHETPSWSLSVDSAPRSAMPAGEPPSYEMPSAESPSWERPSYESSSNETPPSWERPTYESSSLDSSSLDSSSLDSSSFASPSYESPSWRTSPSWETPSSWESSDEPAAGLPAPEAGPSVRSSHAGSVYDDMLFGAMPAVPVEEPSAYDSTGSSSWSADSAADDPAPRAEPPSSGHARLEQILAESGVQTPTGGRSSRRRYRDEDGEAGGDDVLARVLGRN